MNRAAVIGIVLGIAAVVGGNYLESGRIATILQPTAALIVFGGTLGATLLSFPMADIARARASLRDVFREPGSDPHSLIEQIVRFAGIARRNGLIALEMELPRITDPFFRKAMLLTLDHMNARMLRETMEQESMTHEEERRRAAKVFETAGGFAPTIGIIGAVLGLIHVMDNLSDPSRLGAGIAVAFVATIYGVGSANLLLLPVSKILMNRIGRERAVHEMIVEGVVGIQAGSNPHYLREKLAVYVGGHASAHATVKAGGVHRKKTRMAGTAAG